MQSLQINQSGPFLNINHTPFANSKPSNDFPIHLRKSPKSGKLEATEHILLQQPGNSIIYPTSYYSTLANCLLISKGIYK